MTTPTEKSLAQRKEHPSTSINTIPYDSKAILKHVTYGVPASRRMLSRSLLLKKHFQIRDYLLSLGFTTAEREAAFFLLRLFAYYGRVYPKAPNFTPDYYCSKRSFWRAVAKLESLGMLDRINRYLYHLQISNAYRLDKFVLCIIKFLTERGCRIYDEFTRTVLTYINHRFWTLIITLRVRLRDPIPITLVS